jgi:hypothetical protein
VAQHIKLGPRALARALPLCNVRVMAKARARDMHRHQPRPASSNRRLLRDASSSALNDIAWPHRAAPRGAMPMYMRGRGAARCLTNLHAPTHLVDLVRRRISANGDRVCCGAVCRGNSVIHLATNLTFTTSYSATEHCLLLSRSSIGF